MTTIRSAYPVPTTEPSRLVALDGLRAVAVALVIVHHGTVTQTPHPNLYDPWIMGAFGVRLFFVLSGFLITGILVDARDRAAALGWPVRRVLRAFYVRRALRIFPAAYLAMGVAWLLEDEAMTVHGRWYLTYTSNIITALGGWKGDLGHFWSLAVEEQFYLLWPLVALWAPRGWLVPILVSAMVLVGAVRGSMVGGELWLSSYVLLVSRGDALAFGGLLALVPSVTPRALAALGTGLVVIGLLADDVTYAVIGEWGLILVSGAILLWTARGQWPWLRWRPLVALGTISYGLYIWHGFIPPLMRWADPDGAVWPDHQGAIRLAWVAAGSLVCASVSWFLLEKPLNSLKTRAPYVPTGGRTGVG